MAKAGCKFTSELCSASNSGPFSVFKIAVHISGGGGAGLDLGFPSLCSHYQSIGSLAFIYFAMPFMIIKDN